MLTKKELIVEAFEREGYKVSYAQSVTNHSRTAMVQVYFTREDGKDVSFLTKWGVYLSIGNQHDFYTVPISEKYGQTNVAIIVYFSKPRLKSMSDALDALSERVNGNYWVVQKDETACSINEDVALNKAALDRFVHLLEGLAVDNGVSLSLLAQLKADKESKKRNLKDEFYDLLEEFSETDKRLRESALFAEREWMDKAILEF